jgi:aminomethyltransferase
MCNERGGVIDDLYTYRLAADDYLLIVNASRTEDDVKWLETQLAQFLQNAGVKLRNLSDETGAVAIQGPRVMEFIDACFPETATGGTVVKRPSDLKKNQIARFGYEGTDIWIGRTGYTGEDGFEIIASANKIESIWTHLLEAGRPHGLKPAGLGARDTLRTEVCYPLYGHELDESTTPIEAGLGFFVALEKGEFVGRTVLADQKAKGPRKRLVALKMTGKDSPAPAPLRHLERRARSYSNWGSSQWNTKPVLRIWCGAWLRTAGICQAEHPAGN